MKCKALMMVCVLKYSRNSLSSHDIKLTKNKQTNKQTNLRGSGGGVVGLEPIFSPALLL